MLFHKGKFLMYLFYQVNHNPRVKNVDGKKFGIIMIILSSILIALSVLFIVLGANTKIKHSEYEVVNATLLKDASYGGREEYNNHETDYYYIDFAFDYENESYVVSNHKIFSEYIRYTKGASIKVYIYSHDPYDVSALTYDDGSDEPYFPLAIVFTVFSIPAIYLSVQAFLSLTPEGSKKQEERIKAYIRRTCIDPKLIKGLPDDFMMDDASSTSNEEHHEQDNKDINDISSRIEEKQETKEEQPIQYGSRYMKKASSKGIKKRTDKDMEKYKVQ